MATKTQPWKRNNPKKAAGRSKKLSANQKAAAKRSAKKAGRTYPNLVDNMRAAKTERGEEEAVAAAERAPRRACSASRGHASWTKKDVANSDPAEGSREVIERELKRHENDDVEPPQEPEGDENKHEQRKPN